MADLSKTIAIIFSGVDELSGPVKTITSKLNAFSTGVESIASPLAGAADNVLKLDAAITAMAAGGLVYAFNESMKFENAVIELKKVLGDGAGVDQAIADATRLSDIYGQSAGDILLSTADFKQAGFNIKDSMTLTKDALDLVIAGNVGAAKSSEIIIAALKGFGLEADDARRYLDILNHTSQLYATDVEQLGTAMSKISPIAKLMGFSMEETAGLVTPVIEVFRSGDEAAVALKTGLLKLIDDSKPVRTALAELGISQFTLNGAMRSGKDIFIDVATAFQGLSKEEQIYYTQQITGIQQAGRLSTVFGNLELATRIAGDAMNATGSMANEVAERLQSAEVSVDRFKVGFENLSRTIGDQFRLAAQGAIDGGTEIENTLRQMIDAGTFDPVFDVINDFAGKIGNLLSTVAKNMPAAFAQVDFKGLLDALNEIGDSFGELFKDVDLTTPEGLAEVIQNVINTLATLANVTAGMITQFAPFAQSIMGMIKSFNEMDVASQKSAGEILGMAKMVVAAGFEIAAAIIVLGPIAKDLAPVFTTVINAVSFFFDSIKITWNLLGLTVIEILDKILRAVQAFTKNSMFGTGFSDSIQDNRDKLSEWRQSFEDDLVAASFSANEKGGKIIKSMFAIGDSADGASKSVKGTADEINKMPDEKTTDISAQADTDSIAAAKSEIEKAAPEEMVTDVKTKTDQPALDKTKDDIDKAVPFEKKTTAFVKPDQPSITKTKSAINEIPESKMMEIQLKGDIDIELAKIKASAEAMQTAFEWTAKLDIAQIEADAKVASAAFASVGQSVEATASAAADMFSSLLDNWDKIIFGSDRNALMNMVQQQLDMEKEALSIQRDLTEAQIEYMRARADALNNGDGLIKIESDGLEPALEMIMFQILEKIQLRVTEEAAEFLLGLGVSS